MSNAQTQVEKAKDVVPEFVMTKAGFMVVGNELVGDKLTALICETVNSFDKSGITAIVLRNDGYPRQGKEEVFGSCIPDTNSIAINLDRCWDRACEISMKGEKHLSFLGVLWTSVLTTVAHELDHLVLASSDRETYEALRQIDEGADLEDSAKESERQTICRLAREFDTEIPAPSEMGYFGVKWMQLHTDDATKDLLWVQKARQDVQEGIVYREEGTDQKLSTYRQFVKLAYQQDGEGWDQPTNPISLVVYMDGKDEPVLLPAEPSTLR